MNSQLAPRSSYVSTSLEKAEIYEVQDVARRSAMATEITHVANYEMARVGAHAIRTMADLVQGAGNVRRALLESGHRSGVYDDFNEKVLEVTGQNVLNLTNTTQHRISIDAVSHLP